MEMGLEMDWKWIGDRIGDRIGDGIDWSLPAIQRLEIELKKAWKWNELEIGLEISCR